MSQSPIDAQQQGADRDRYLENWNRLARRIREGASFSGRERNCGFLNTGGTRFAEVSGALGLDWPDDGRGLAVVDWDHDGDLDFWLANRTGPSVRFLENRLDGAANHLALELQGVSCNRDAIGARVEVRLVDGGKRLVRSLRAGEGFLSQSSKVMHFGLGEGVRIEQVLVTWPGTDEPQRFDGLEANRRYRLVEGTREAVPLPARATAVRYETSSKIASGPSGALAPANSRRTLLTQRRALPAMDYVDGEGQRKTLKGTPRERPLLVNLWASWCAPCLQEMQELTAARGRVDGRLDIVALSVDAVAADTTTGSAVSLPAGAASEDADESSVDAARERVKQLSWPYGWGFVSRESLRAWTEMDHAVFYRTQPLPLPCSLLVDARGRVAAIYKGPLSMEQLEEDVRRLDADDNSWREAASPFGGRSVAPWFSPDRAHAAQAYLEGGYREDARTELDRFFSEPLEAGRGSRTLRRLAWKLRAEIAGLDQNATARLDALRALVREQPDAVDSLAELALACQQANLTDEADKQLATLATLALSDPRAASLLVQTQLQLGKLDQAPSTLVAALRRFPDDPRLRYMRAMSAVQQGKTDEAINFLRSLVADQPALLDAANDLAWLLAMGNGPGPAATDAPSATEEALRLAERICSDTSRTEPQFLDTLARVHAVRGDWQQAAAIAEEARRAAAAQGDEPLTQKLLRRRDDYRQQRIGD